MTNKKLIYRKFYLTIIFCFFYSNSSIAATVQTAQPSGDVFPYIIGQLGYANTHLKNDVAFFTHKYGWSDLYGLSNSGLSARIALGLKINPYFSLEAGYFNVIGNSKLEDVDTFNESKLNLQQSAFDVNAKATLPLANYFNIYGKAGLAYLTTTLSNRFTKDSLPDTNFVINMARRQLAPEIGLGVTYNLASNLLVDLSWTHIQPLGNNKPGTIDFFAAGLGVSFC